MRDFCRWAEFVSCPPHVQTQQKLLSGRRLSKLLQYSECRALATLVDSSLLKKTSKQPITPITAFASKVSLANRFHDPLAPQQVQATLLCAKAASPLWVAT
jgi:hypothetical protein